MPNNAEFKTLDAERTVGIHPNPTTETTLMTMKKKILAFVVVLVLTTLTNFLIHVVLLQGVYQQNANLMRPPQDQSHAHFLLVGFFFFAVAFV